MARWALDEACLVEGRRVERLVSEGKNAFAGASTASGVPLSAQRGYASAPKRLIKKVSSVDEFLSMRNTKIH